MTLIQIPKGFDQDINKYTITEVNINRNTVEQELIGETGSYFVDGMLEVSFTAKVDPRYMQDLIDTSAVPIISGVLDDSVYIFKECNITGFDYNSGSGYIDIDVSAKDVVIHTDMNIQFIDIQKNVSAANFARVYECYGDPQKMTYEDFCKKCLAVSI